MQRSFSSAEDRGPAVRPAAMCLARPVPARPPSRASFAEAVAAVLDGIPPGVVLTYGEVASEAGYPGAARAVGTHLARSGGRHPWWRVVTASGRLVPGHEADQARRLRAEGISVSAGRVALRR